MKKLIPFLFLLAACEPNEPLKSVEKGTVVCDRVDPLDVGAVPKIVRCVDREAGNLCYLTEHGISCVDLVVRSALVGNKQ